MYNYVNKINIATNQDKTEVILNFIQESPQFIATPTDESEKITMQPTLKSESVADIVVTGSFAKEIARLILSVAGE